VFYIIKSIDKIQFLNCLFIFKILHDSITLMMIRGYGKIKSGFKCAVILKVQLSKNQIYYHQYSQEFDMEELNLHLLVTCSLFSQISWMFILLAVDGNVIHKGLIVVSE